MKSDINLYGSDFVKSSVDLINEMGDHYGLSMKSELFNMLEPNYDYQIKENSCVFTHGAIEQLAGNFKNFINYLIQKKPKENLYFKRINFGSKFMEGYTLMSWSPK